MNKLNVKSISELLLKNKKSNIDLARHIGMKNSNLTAALNGTRPFPFGYVFKIADFFKLSNPKILIMEDKDEITNKQSNPRF